MRLVALLVGLGVVVLSTPVAAQEIDLSGISRGPVVKIDRPVEPEWYGWKILVSDGLSLAAGTTAVYGSGVRVRDDDQGLFLGSRVGYGLSMPLAVGIHQYHDEPWRAAGSFALRMALPVVMAMNFALVNCMSRDFSSRCGRSATTWGFLVGSLAASGIDAGAVARGSSHRRWDEENQHWYGWQIGIADAAALVVVGGAMLGSRDSWSSEPIADISLAIAVAPMLAGLPAAVIHIINGRPLAGLASGLTRILGVGALLGLGTLLGECTATSFGPGCATRGITMGMAIGGLTIAATDIFWGGWYSDGPRVRRRPVQEPRMEPTRELDSVPEY